MASTPQRPDLAAELRQRADRDQRARRALSIPPTPDEWEACRVIDLDNYTWLRGLIAEHGWPDADLVGADGAHAAWLIAQHAPHNLQQQWLPLLRNAVERGAADPVDLAYLDDRVRTGEGRPQRYGTQWRVRGGERRLEPVDDPEHLNDRRRTLGLSPISTADLADVWPHSDSAP
ncbi:DUF6624 domain-containing protein [Streptoalloteichus tenebrarius]|uniref:DUF6624 domain-containing protein n=1 Tax=Streptoalloteichus tenebrarius (strain ATCC 17920 / DSM 40477 / JCM 4838 / CBS 697.72 / NBRC 16177 / NCIMB 11028 / NRRL B-12390 / A12253. 1 / ISP 5477) TaxID=1933 RepID=UPI0020A244D7|nr:DUF6624 domain-containing protein [Streptoalloteichus tenebrarius]